MSLGAAAPAKPGLVLCCVNALSLLPSGPSARSSLPGTPLGMLRLVLVFLTVSCSLCSCSRHVARVWYCRTCVSGHQGAERLSWGSLPPCLACVLGCPQRTVSPFFPLGFRLSLVNKHLDLQPEGVFFTHGGLLTSLNRCRCSLRRWVFEQALRVLLLQHGCFLVLGSGENTSVPSAPHDLTCMARSGLPGLTLFAQVLQRASSFRGLERVTRWLFPKLPPGGDKAPSGVSQRWDPALAGAVGAPSQPGVSGPGPGGKSGGRSCRLPQ